MNYTVRVEQSKNKHSRAVVKDSTIIVRLAKRLTIKQQQEHLDELVTRMKKRMSKQLPRTLIQPFNKLTANQTSFIPLNNGHTFQIQFVQSTKNRVSIQGEYHVKLQYIHYEPKVLQAKLWKLLSKVSTPYFTEQIHALNAKSYNVRIQKIVISHRTSAWGSMSTTGVIRLNPALLFVPAHLRDYVILHELAHGKVPNHSAKFWREVERIVPDYKHCVKELKGFRLN